MASANDPMSPTGIQAAAPQATSTAVQATPPGEAPSIPLPPHPKRAPVTVEQVTRWTRPLDVLLVASVVVLAFLLASFAARLADLLLNLATGRAFLDGTYHLGKDPFAFTTEGVRWVNHSWLYDVTIYLLYTKVGGPAIGGPALVVLKALAAAALAGFMLAVRRRGQSPWIPAVCSGIAILAVGQRLFLQPVVVSYLFLGVTLYLLQKPAAVAVQASKRRPAVLGPRRHLWLLPPLFLLWVNLDAWFFLGPATVALFWIGELIQNLLGPVREGPDRRGRSDDRTFGLVLLAGLIACLANPHHVHAFTWPAQFTSAAGILQSDPYFAPMLYNLFDYYDWKRGVGWSVVGVANLVLLGLGLLSFAANHRDWRGWRILIWTAFASLALYNARCIPFFAIVGGPISALNFQDAIARYFGIVPRITPNWRQWAIAGRFFTLVAAIVLIALAWPGWLHATVRRGESPSRNVAWRVDFDPSLKKVGEQFAKWHADGVLAEGDRGLNFSPEIAFAFAWFAPAERGFLDTRFALYEKPAADYAEALKALAPDPRMGDTARQLEPLARIMRRHHANHLVFYFNPPDRFPGTLAVFESDRTRQFRLVYRDGHAAVFSWNDPEDKTSPNRLTEARIPDDRLAFGPQSEPPIMDRPPAPQTRAWYERYFYPRQVRPLASDEAAMHLQYFGATLPLYVREHGQATWLPAQAAALVGSGAQAPLVGEPLLRALATDALFELTKPLLLGPRAGKERPAAIRDLASEGLNVYVAGVPGPTAQPLLAVRAARRALLQDPNDPEAWYRLQFAYAMLSQNTRERDWLLRVPSLPALRQAQRMVALNHAVKLDPDSENAHRQLAQEYERLSYLDLALNHRSEEQRVLVANGPVRNETREAYERRREALEDHVNRLKDLVKKGQDEYELGEITKTNVRAKAELALSKGLAAQARDILLRSVEATVEPDAVPLQLQLMIATGQIEGEEGIRITLDNAVKDSEETGRKPNLGQVGQGQYFLPRFEWMQVLVAAASGDYRAADEILAPIAALREQAHANLLRLGTRVELLDVSPVLPPRGMLFNALLNTQVTPMTLFFSLQQAVRVENLRMAASTKPQVADLYALRGLLALEAGDNAHAAKMFRKVLELEDPVARPVAKYYLDLLEANGKW